MLADDPWINEGYDTSPIVADISQIMVHDENIVTLIGQRFKVDRDTIMASLNENAYDDIGAVYYLMYHEKDTRGKIESEVNAMAAGGPQKSLLLGSPTHTIVSDADSPKTTKPPAMNKIGEDEVDDDEPAALPSSTARPLKNNADKPRKRRQTVGGENEFAKLGAEEEEPAAIPGLKKVTAQMGDMSIAEPAAAPSPLPVQREKAQAPRPVTVVETRVSVEQPSADTINPAPPAGEEQSNGQRKRHNTIVGILRSTIRRPSDAVNNTFTPPTPTSDKGTNDFPSSVQEEEETGDSKPGEPRSLRFTFNSNSTSSKNPDEIVGEVLATCKKHQIAHKLVNKYVIECSHASGPEPVKFEIEICKLPRLKNLHGLRFKRVSGPSSDYKDVCELILSNVAL